MIVRAGSAQRGDFERSRFTPPAVVTADPCPAPGGEAGPWGVRQEGTPTSAPCREGVSDGQGPRSGTNVDHGRRTIVLRRPGPSTPALHDPDGHARHRLRARRSPLLPSLVAGSGLDHHHHTAAVGRGHPGQLAVPPVPLRLPEVAQARRTCPRRLREHRAIAYRSARRSPASPPTNDDEWPLPSMTRWRWSRFRRAAYRPRCDGSAASFAERAAAKAPASRPCSSPNVRNPGRSRSNTSRRPVYRDQVAASCTVAGPNAPR